MNVCQPIVTVISLSGLPKLLECQQTMLVSAQVTLLSTGLFLACHFVLLLLLL